MRVCQIVRIVLRPIFPRNFSSFAVSSSSAKPSLKRDHSYLRRCTPSPNSAGFRLRLGTGGPLQLPSPKPSWKPVQQLEQRLHLAMLVTGTCLLLCLVSMALWLNTGFMLMNSGNCGKDLSVGVVRNPLKLPSFKWNVLSKIDDQQDVGHFANDRRPTANSDDLARKLDSRKRKDEILHFGFVVGGSSAARQLHVLTKIIFYNQKEGQLERKGTTTATHFHIICDQSACMSIRVLFQSWRIEGLMAHFYNIEPYLKEINWIPTVHYSGIYGLAKLIVPEIIPAHIQWIIFLDLDIVITCNLKNLWNYFDEFSDDEVIGLIENQSDWYLQARTPTRWPAVDRGFNTGVALMDIHKMRRNAWGDHWRNVTKHSLQRLSYTALADQDIVNAALFYDSRRVKRLPCKWNVQLADSVDYANCLRKNDSYSKFEDVFCENACILHWNKPIKLADTTFPGHDAELQNVQKPTTPSTRVHPFLNPRKFRTYFEKLQTFFAGYDGNLFRKKDSIFNSDPERIPTHKSHGLSQSVGFRTGRSKNTQLDCLNLREETELGRRIHPYFFGKLNDSQKTDKESYLSSSKLRRSDITLVSQLTIDRLHRLEEMASHWDGPISLALYVTDKEVLLLTEYIQNIPILSKRQDLFIHLMFKEGNFYPINALRNIAMEYATTDYVFLVDFDFIPTPRMHTYLRDTLSSQISKDNDLEDEKQTSQNKGIKTSTTSRTKVTWEKDSRPVAYVIPAFETFYTQINFPINKIELLNQIKTGIVKPFRIDVWPAGHQATNYTHWYNSSVPYEVKWEADFEPYVVVKKTAARFDARFLGFGWNKVAYAMLLDALGYRFLVLPEVFVIHLPHSPSMDVSRFRNSPFFRMCLERFKVEFIKELAHNYGVRSLKYLQFRQRPNGL